MSLLSVSGTSAIQPVSHLIHAKVLGIYDLESGIREYFAAVGTPNETEAMRDWRSIGTNSGEMLIGGLDLDDGWVTVSVRATNNAYESSEVALELGIDTRPPRCSTVSLNGVFEYPGEQYASPTVRALPPPTPPLLTNHSGTPKI